MSATSLDAGETRRGLHVVREHGRPGMSIWPEPRELQTPVDLTPSESVLSRSRWSMIEALIGWPLQEVLRSAAARRAMCPRRLVFTALGMIGLTA